MRVTCQKCKKQYDIPDSRLPQGKKIAFPCRECQALVEIDLTPHVEKTKDASPSDSAARSKSDPPAKEKKQLAGDALKKVVLSKIHKLPAMPEVVVKALQIVRQPDASFKAISDILATDQAITIGVLKTANSAYYGQTGKIASVHGAAIVLGLQSLVDLISIVGTAKLLKVHLKGYGLNADYLWKHSLAAGLAAKILARKQESVNEHDAFTAGLIHDVGKIVLDPYVAERMDGFVAYRKTHQGAFYQAEKRLLGLDHGEIASDLFRVWNIPQEIRQGVKFHHDPAKFNKPMAHIVHAANLIAKRTAIEPEQTFRTMGEERDSFTWLQINEPEIALIVEEVENAVTEIMT